MAKTPPAEPAFQHVYPVAGDTYVVLPEEGAELPIEEARVLLARGLVTLSPEVREALADVRSDTKAAIADLTAALEGDAQ